MELPYYLAQKAIIDLKAAVYLALQQFPDGVNNATLGRSLGIYDGYDGQHNGHLPRLLLAMMENEGLVQRDEKGLWHLKAGAPGLLPAKP